jgi:predicted transcriptional regulator
MATTVHIPRGLLEQIDRRAKARGISRNRYIVEALSSTLAEETEWPAGFIEGLRELGESDKLREAVDEMLGEITARRRSRREPPGPPRAADQRR